jgi:hypothetical protein
MALGNPSPGTKLTEAEASAAIPLSGVLFKVRHFRLLTVIGLYRRSSGKNLSVCNRGDHMSVVITVIDHQKAVQVSDTRVTRFNRKSSMSETTVKTILILGKKVKCVVGWTGLAVDGTELHKTERWIYEALHLMDAVELTIKEIATTLHRWPRTKSQSFGLQTRVFKSGWRAGTLPRLSLPCQIPSKSRISARRILVSSDITFPRYPKRRFLRRSKSLSSVTPRITTNVLRRNPARKGRTVGTSLSCRWAILAQIKESFWQAEKAVEEGNNGC